MTVTVTLPNTKKLGYALSQKIAVAVKHSKKLENKIDEAAHKKRIEITSLARSYFSEMLKQSVDMVEHGTVGVEGRIARRETPGRKKRRGRRPSDYFTAYYTRMLSKEGSAGERIRLKLRWAKLSYKYYRRDPYSKRFFLKRLRTPRYISQSTGAAFVRNFGNASSIAKKISLTSSYQKKKLKDLKYNKEEKIMSYGFIINYPSLDTRYDGLRVAFINGAKNSFGEVDFKSPDGIKTKDYDLHDHGIGFADEMRPLFGQFSEKMGAAFLKRLKKL
jgi:hypothetical protein